MVQKLQKMFNNSTLAFLFFILVPLALSIRQSDIGTNDWSLQNIGKITQLSFAPLTQEKNARQYKNIFYLSELGIYGLLNRRNGDIVHREQLADGEKILESDDKEIVILSGNGQIVRYTKLNMQRVVDNRMMTKEFRNINSYVRANSRIYVSDDKVIRQMPTLLKSIDQLSTTEAPTGTSFLKIFACPTPTPTSTPPPTPTPTPTPTLQSLSYSPSKQQACLNQLKQGSLTQKYCMSATIDTATAYAKVFESTGNIYFGDANQHYYINFINFENKKFNSKPVSFGHYGVTFQNGLTFTTKNINNGQEGKVVFVQTNKIDAVVVGEIRDGFLYVKFDNGDKIATVSLHGKQFQVSRVWTNFLSPTQTQTYIQFQDLQLSLYTTHTHTSTSTPEHKQLWSREQSLAYIQKVLFMKYEGYQDHLNTNYHKKMDDPHFIQLSFVQKIQQIPINFVHRVRSQFEDFVEGVAEILGWVRGLVRNVGEFQRYLDVRGYLKSTMSSDKQKKYGLQKYIIIITKHNTIFSLDSKTSTIIWKKKQDKDHKLITLIKLKQSYQKQIAIKITYKYHITYLTQINQDGSFIELQDFQTGKEPHIFKISPHSIIVKTEDKVYRYDVNKDIEGREQVYGFYEVEGQQEGANARVIGWRVNGEQLVQTWQFQIPTTEHILSTTPSYKGQPSSRLPIQNQKKVLFKNVDFSNLAILTLQTHTLPNDSTSQQKTVQRLHLYIINSLTGTIQYNQYQSGINSKLPINLIYDQHNVIVSYYNVRNKVYQIWTVQAYQAPLESQLISKKYLPSFEKDDIVFRSKVYGTVLPIKKMFISQSKQALLKRNLLLITRQNKIYWIPREHISTRRPKSSQPESPQNLAQSQFITSKYPAEEYILPINTLNFLNYNKKMADIETMRFSSSDLESTIFIMVYGIDLFLVRIAPDKSFDMLADGFNYVQLVAIMIAVTIAAIFFRNKAKQAKLKKPHLE